MEEEFWINPLGILHKYIDDNENPETLAEMKSQSIDTFFNIVLSANKQIRDLKKYILAVRYPEIDLESLSSQRFEFLRIPEEILTVNDDTLKKIFHHLQKFAVVLYEIINDTLKTEKESEYHQKLKLTREKLKQMIANIQLAILVSKLAPLEDVTYSMLPAHMKVTKPSQRAIRDTIVIRDYSNFLQKLLGLKP